MNGQIELAVISVQARTVRCFALDSGLRATLRGEHKFDLVPGEIATVRIEEEGRTGPRHWIRGKALARRLDAAALGLKPLRLEPRSVWDPAEEYWGEEGDPPEEWAKPIIGRGPRQGYEMEQVIPGEDPEDPFDDPVTRAVDAAGAGKRTAARKILMDLCEGDLRCLDAHSHLGLMAFDRRPELALRHYEAGVRIGELSLGRRFRDVLLWGWIDNRPFLRCMHGYGLCLWRLRRFKEAAEVFDRMLWLNPRDNQGVRGLIEEVRQGTQWRDREDW